MSDDRLTSIMHLLMFLKVIGAAVDGQALRDLCEQNGIHITLDEATEHVDAANKRLAADVGTVGGASRVCPCGSHRVYLPQVKLWACPKCQKSLATEPSEN